MFLRASSVRPLVRPSVGPSVVAAAQLKQTLEYALQEGLKLEKMLLAISSRFATFVQFEVE